MDRIRRVFLFCLLLCYCMGATACAAAAEQKPKTEPLDPADQQMIQKLEKQERIDIGSGVTILGPAEAKPQQMVRYIRMHNAAPKLNCSVEELVSYYYQEGTAEGVRPDVALCQAIKETGCFGYGGDVTAAQNNYCGLGATGHGARGSFFVTPQRGVRAHIQHLMCYATTRLPKTDILDTRYDVLRTKYAKYYGKIPYWTGLNGKWAVPGKNYGQEILQIWQEAKAL